MTGTPVCHFRPFRAEDSGLLVEYLNTPEVSYFLSSLIPQPYTLKDANWWIETGSKQGWTHAIESAGRLAGCIGATRNLHERCRSAEIGYWLAKPFWGRGIVTQALQRLT